MLRRSGAWILAGGLCALAIGVSAGEPSRLLGTRVHLERPPGFAPSTRFTGFEALGESARIGVAELPRSLEAALADLKPEVLARRGATLISREELEIDGLPGVLALTHSGDGATAISRWLAFFGDGEGIVLLQATCPRRREAALRQTVRRTFLGARWDRERKIDPFEGLGFAIRGSHRLVFTQRFGNVITYTRDGVMPARSPEDPVLVVTPSKLVLDAEARAQFCTAAIEKIGNLQDLVMGATREIEVDGMPGCEALARATEPKSGAWMVVYQAGLFPPGGFYSFQGQVGLRFRWPYAHEFSAMVRAVRQK